MIIQNNVEYVTHMNKQRSTMAILKPQYKSSLQCYSVLSDIWVKIELCIPLESELSILSTCNAFACLSPPSKLNFAVLLCSICKGLISFSAILF